MDMRSVSKTFPNEKGEDVMVLVRYSEHSPEFALIITRDNRMVVGNSALSLLEMRYLENISKTAIDLAFPDKMHPSHIVRGSDASSYDCICVNCGCTDRVPGGWGELRFPCKNVKD